MPKMSKTKQLVRYRKRIDHARAWREEEGFDQLWQRMVDLYTGKQFDDTSHEDQIAINLAFSTINVIFPSITLNNPKVTVSARKPEDDDKSVIAEAVVNYWWKHYNFRDPFRRASKDFLTIGHGVVKIGWKYEEVEEKIGDDERAEHFGELKDQADEFAQVKPELAPQLPTDDEIVAALPDSKTVALEDRPYIERISPADMLVDPEATNPEDLRWIAQRIVRPLEDVRADKRYNYTARKSVKADASIRSEHNYPDESRKRDGDIDRVTVWEFYDIAQNTMCAFAEDGDDYLVDPTQIPYAFGHPFEFIQNYEVPDRFYAMGDLEQIECIQAELNQTRTQLMNHRKKYSNKYLFRETAIGPDGRQALESNQDNIGVPIIDDSPFGEVIAPMPINAMSGELYQYSDVMEADMDKVSGVNEYARGATPEIRRTATEAAIINDAAASRAADKLAVIEASVSRIGRKVMQLAQQYLTGEQVARVVGLDGSQLWVPFDNDDISGEFSFEVEGGSTQPQNDQARRQEAIGLMQTMTPFMQLGIINPMELAKHVLQKGFGIKNPGKFLQMPPPPPPMEAPPGEGGPPPGEQNQSPAEGQQPQGPPQGGPPPPPPEMAPGVNGLDPFNGGVGADAPQLAPEELLALQQAAAQAGIDPNVLAQLQGQVGLGI